MHAKSTSVAVVDDDFRVLESMDELLQSAGYNVLLFHTPRDLLESGDLSMVDCVISDISMPDMNGLELEKQIKRIRPFLPMILITGRNEFAQAAAEVAAGSGRHFFEKPFDGSKLLAAVRSCVVRRIPQPD